MLSPYLTLDGNAKEAIDFYVCALDGIVEFAQTFGDAPVEAPAEWNDKIMHASIKCKGFVMMFSDAMPGFDVKVGNNINLSLNFETPEEQTAVFNKLAEGGVITMPLEKQFWGARFGMLIDKFGVNWMTNCEMPE